MNEQVPRNLSQNEVSGMPVNERLWATGLIAAYEEAAAKRDIEAMTEILKSVHLDSETIEANLRFDLGTK